MGDCALAQKVIMFSLFSVLLVCIFFMWVHRMIHMAGRKRHAISLGTVSVYLIGIVPLIILLQLIHSDIVFSSLLLYLLLSAILSFLYVGVILGGETPSSMILHAFKSRPRMSLSQIESLFSEKQLIWKRIEDLRSSGMVEITPTFIVCTKKGMQYARIITAYETIFHRKKRG